MAVTSTVSKIAVSLVLNNGVDEKGSIKTVNASLGSFNPSNFDNEKAMNIKTALEPCLSKTVMRVNKTTTEILSD